MPRIAEFYGIVIAMYHNDHEPAHFHAAYAGQRAVIGMDPARVLDGTLPPRALRMVMAWATAHHLELRDNWRRARAGQPLARIAPLD
ncbi:MAG TPA: DUF4160 domain-containing protein [Chloroflexota bacterium]|jgi:hypothetical protein